MGIEQAETADQMEQEASTTYEKVKEKAGQVRERLEDVSSRMRSQAEDSIDEVTELVRENPMTSVGIALVVGIGFGSLLTALANRD